MVTTLPYGILKFQNQRCSIAMRLWDCTEELKEEYMEEQMEEYLFYFRN